MILSHNSRTRRVNSLSVSGLVKFIAIESKFSRCKSGYMLGQKRTKVFECKQVGSPVSQTPGHERNVDEPDIPLVEFRPNGHFQAVEMVEWIVGQKFKDESLIEEALTYPS